MSLKTTRITVETDTLMVVRRAKTVLAWCPDCRSEVNVITLGSDGPAQAATAAQLQQWLNTGKLHFWQHADGPAQICVPSLLQCIECEGVQTFSPSHPDPLNQPRRKGMKLTRSIANLFRVTGFALALALLAGPVRAEEHPAMQPSPAAPHYAVVDLGTLGGTFSLAYAINDRGQVDGFSTIPGDGAIHSFLFENRMMNDLGTLGGPNSQSFAGLNNVPQVPGSSDTSTSDPNGEDFCGFGTNLICLGFVWQNGVMTPLPAPGGNNSQAAGINNQGAVVGYAETSKSDPDCPPPQVLQFRPVVWSGRQIEVFPLYPGDSEGVGFWINNQGELVGASGICAAYDGRYGVGLAPKHALLWRKGSGVPIDLGNLGGTFNNAAFAINDRSQIIGASDVSGDTYQHAFLWQKGMLTDLGTLPGDVVSAALGINNRGQITGVSDDGNGHIRAFLWQNGVMTDLNSLIDPNSPLYLLHGYGINSSGEIVGLAVNTSSGEAHAFLAIPTSFGDGAGSASSPTGGSGGVGARVTLSENARKQLQQWVRFGRFGDEPPDPCVKNSKLGLGCKAN